MKNYYSILSFSNILIVAFLVFVTDIILVDAKDQQTKRIDNLRSRKVVDDDIPSLEDDEEEETLRPVHIFSSTATFMLDGIEQDYIPDTSNLYYKRSKKRGTTTVILAQEDESLGVRTKKIKRDSTIKQTERHVDIKELNKHFFYAHAERNTTTTTSINNTTSDSSSNDRIINHDLKKNTKSNNHDRRRNLRNAPILVLSNDSDVLTPPPVNHCFRYMNVELAIAFETSFCETMGGADEAVAEISRIIAEVSARYQEQGLCTSVSISHLEGYCELEKDPYRYYVGMNRSGCGSYGLLHKFQEFWERKRTRVKRDVAHLFTGTGLECSDDGCIVGCGFTEGACTEEAYGVDFITYTEHPTLRTILVAHELGHNLGAQHNSDKPGYIMNPYINVAPNGFSEASKYQFINHIMNTECITIEDEAF